MISKRLQPIGAASLFLIMSILMHWPFWSVGGVDEAFFLTVGREWLHGHAPYIGAFDVKPPGIFAATALAELIFGPTIAAMKYLLAAFVALCAFALHQFSRRFLGGAASLYAPLLYIFASLALCSTGVSVELIGCGLTATAILIGFAACRNQASILMLFLAGLVFGAAAMVKQTCILEALAILPFMPPRASRWFAFIIGLTIVPLGFAVFYFTAGHFDLFWRDSIVAAATRVQGSPSAFLIIFIRAYEILPSVLPIFLCALFLWFRRQRWQTEAVFPALRLIFFWILAALLGIIAQKGLYNSYFEKLLPPLCLAAGFCFDQGFNALRLPRSAPIILFIGSLAYMTAYFLPDAWQARGVLQAEHEVASKLTQMGQRKTDHILVLDRYLELYLFTNTEPPTGIFHPQHLLCSFPLVPENALSSVMEAKPAFILRSREGARLLCERPDRLAELKAALSRDYCAVAHFPVPNPNIHDDTITIYALRERLGSSCASDEKNMDRHTQQVS